MFRKFCGQSVLLAAAPVAAKELKTQDESKKPVTYRPQELPIYSTVYENDAKRFGLKDFSIFPILSYRRRSSY